MSPCRLGPERLRPGPTTTYAIANAASAASRITIGTVPPDPPPSARIMSSGIVKAPGLGVDARRTLGVLLEGVGRPGGAGQRVAEVDAELALAIDEGGVAVEPTRCGPAGPLPVAVVPRPVARALEPLRRLAPRHPTPQVGAGLGVQRHQPGGVVEDGVVGAVVALG